MFRFLQHDSPFIGVSNLFVPKNEMATVCGARFLEAALSGSAEFQITGYIDGARGDRVSRANAGSRAPLSNSPCNHFPTAIGRAPRNGFDSS